MELVTDHIVWAIVRYATGINSESPLEIGSLWATAESAEEQITRERERYKISPDHDDWRVIQMIVGKYI